MIRSVSFVKPSFSLHPIAYEYVNNKLMGHEETQHPTITHSGHFETSRFLFSPWPPGYPSFQGVALVRVVDTTLHHHSLDIIHLHIATSTRGREKHAVAEKGTQRTGSIFLQSFREEVRSTLNISLKYNFSSRGSTPPVFTMNLGGTASQKLLREQLACRTVYYRQYTYCTAASPCVIARSGALQTFGLVISPLCQPF